MSPKCLCSFRGPERFAHGACFAMHDSAAVGFVNAKGECVDGFWAGPLRGLHGTPPSPPSDEEQRRAEALSKGASTMKEPEAKAPKKTKNAKPEVTADAE